MNDVAVDALPFRGMVFFIQTKAGEGTWKESRSFILILFCFDQI